MVKIKMNQSPSLGSNTFNTGKHTYTFIGVVPEEITDSEDVAFFKNKPEFDVEGFTRKIKEKLPEPKEIIPDEEEPKEPKDEKVTRKELESLAGEMTFKDFKSWANRKYKVTGRSKEGIIKDILAVQSGEKKPELE